MPREEINKGRGRSTPVDMYNSKIEAADSNKEKRGLKENTGGQKERWW